MASAMNSQRRAGGRDLVELAIVGSCIRAASGSAGRSVKPDPRHGWPVSRRAPGASRSTRSSDAAKASGRADRGIERAPRTPSRSPVRRTASPPSPTSEEARWSGRGPGVWIARRGTSPAVEHLEVGQLADVVWQRPAAARPRQHRDPSVSASASAPAAWSGSTWVSATASMAPPRPAARLDRPVEAGPGRVARVDQHEPAAADEVGADRLARDAAAGRHDDPGDARRDLAPRRPRRSGPGASLARGSRRSSRRARAAGASCSSAATARRVRRPSPRAHRPGGAKRGRRPRRLRTSARRRPGAPPRRTARRTAAGSRDGVTQRDSGTSRSVRSAKVERVGDARDRRLAGRAAPSAPPRRRAIGALRVGEQDAGLLEQLADRRDDTRRGPPRTRGRRPSAAAASVGRDADRAASPDRRRPRRPGRPGRRAAPPANAIVAGRWVSSTSSPWGPGRSRTTVAAGRASAPLAARSWSLELARRRSARPSVTGRRQTKPRQT